MSPQDTDYCESLHWEVGEDTATLVRSAERRDSLLFIAKKQLLGIKVSCRQQQQ
jgi:hypothetical protein